MNYDSDFLAFAKRLGSDSPLFPIRDMLFNAVYFRQIGSAPLMRNKWGLFSWLIWAVQKSLEAALQPSQPPVENADSAGLGVLVSGWGSAHWQSVRPIVEAAVQKGNLPVSLWVLHEKDMPHEDSLLPHCKIHSLYNQPQIASPRLSMIPQVLREAIGAAHRLGFGSMSCPTSLMCDALLNYHSWFRTWQALLPRASGQTVLVTSESAPVARSFVQVARNNDARVCHVCHGLPFESHAVTNATDLLPFSRMDAQWFLPRVPTSTRVRDLGNPRMHAVRSEVLERSPAKFHVPLRILSLSNGIEPPYMANDEAQDFAILRLPPDLEKQTLLRVRPHPRENAPLLLERLEQIGLPGARLSTGSLAEDLAWADVCVTPWSTSLLEALVCERACFWNNARNDRMVHTGDYIDAGLGTLVTNAADWAGIISSILEDPRAAERYRRRGRELAEAGLIPKADGKDWYERVVA